MNNEYISIYKINLREIELLCLYELIKYSITSIIVYNQLLKGWLCNMVSLGNTF